MVSLVIGGARSGKSRYALSLAAGTLNPVYIATARAEDAEMAARIAEHQRERPGHWRTVEEPLRIGAAIEKHAPAADFLLVDCLTLWLSNFFWEYRDKTPPEIERGASEELSRALNSSGSARLVVVTNEVGYGLVPESTLGRNFRDLQGRINQSAAARADEVVQLVAGIPVVIKRAAGAR